MTSALIGHTGFVGSNLLAAEQFDTTFNSSNTEDIRGRSFDRIVCVGARAEKWIANSHPKNDRRNIEYLINCLSNVRAETFTLISTIDIFIDQSCVDETVVPTAFSHAYGLHRWILEDFTNNFDNYRIVRLPALFGYGLKKNVLFDLMNGYMLDVINPESRYQWYPVARLANDLHRIEAADITTVNLVTEPIATREIIERFFPGAKVGENAGPTISQDVHTKHAGLWGRTGPYVLSKAEVFDEMAKFLSERGMSDVDARASEVSV